MRRQLLLQRQRVFGIRREDKNVWERRIPLIPKHVRSLVNSGIKVIVQPSSIRCYADWEYEEVGAIIQEDLSEADTIMAVKEVPPDLLIPNKTYLFFSHTIKAQPNNMPLLDSILQKKIRLIDYERIRGESGRLVKFGPYAGYAGMVDTLHALGISMLARGIATPFLHVSLAKEYANLEAARHSLLQLGELIRVKGLPKEVCPLTFVVTGTGSVSLAAQQMLHCLPCHYVEPSALKKIWNARTHDRKTVYVAVASPKDYMTRRDGGAYNRDEYYAHPEKYIPQFAENIAPYTRVLVNCMYWDPNYAKLLTLHQCAELHSKNKFPLCVLGDITCDPGGSVELLHRPTTIADPFFGWDMATQREVAFHSMPNTGVAILGVDHLPAEFPAQASEYFGDPLVPLVKEIQNDLHLPLEEQSLPPELKMAVITTGGKLTKDYEYIDNIRKSRIKVSAESSSNNVLILGAGMVSGPVLEYLLENVPNVRITIADKDIAAANKVKGTFAKEADKGKVTAMPLEVEHIDVLDTMIRSCDLVISLLPYNLHVSLLPSCIKHKKHIFTTSYEQKEQLAYSQDAQDAGILMLNEMGLDPGIDLMTSIQQIRSVEERGGSIESYQSWCGALPAPEFSGNCMGYKFSWSPQGVLRAITRPSRFKYKGHEAVVNSGLNYSFAVPFSGFHGMKLTSIPNGDALNYGQIFGLGDDCHTIMRNTFRFDGFTDTALAFLAFGLLEEASQPSFSFAKHLQDVLAEKTGMLNEGNGQDMNTRLFEYLALWQRIQRRKVKEACSQWKGLDNYLRELNEEVNIDKSSQNMVDALIELDLLDNKGHTNTSPFRSLTDKLLAKLSLLPLESDMVIMHHEMAAVYPGNKKSNYTFSMVIPGVDSERTATAKTVGLPIAIAATMMLNGSLTSLRGMQRPLHKDIYVPVLKELVKSGLKWTEKEVFLS